MKKISFDCNKKALKKLQEIIEGYPDNCLRIVKVEDIPGHDDIVEITVKYYHPRVLICLGGDRERAESLSNV